MKGSIVIIFVLAALALEAKAGLEVTVVSLPKDCSVKAKNGDTVSVHYTGKLEKTHTEFDSSYKRGRPIDFKLGAGQVIKGWDQGILGK
ncbi:hypothetical protein QBZ16_005444 [Prototheca wickerhamii]|uniref:peptidylprolyl isomerase n=1 Tax=Prototheca wickerhamii TaxID=3111 RepID=A0AAD9IEA2_PROWI|nr:hypothetical protein QBZ16_005444 [Prototheca wickerhamii]